MTSATSPFARTTILFSLTGILVGISPTATAEQTQPGALATQTDQAALQRLAEMRFGVMWHWGPSVLRNKEVSWSMSNREEYESHYPKFNPKSFDADSWVSIAASAGAKYGIFVCKHHDGFCMWDTRTTDNNIMNTPFNRDVTAELADAFEKHNLTFGTYLSIMDIHEAKWDRCYPARTEMPGYPEGIPHIENITEKQTVELIEKYDSKIMWYDGAWLEGWRDGDSPEKVAMAIRKTNPEVLFTRLGPKVDDFECMEARVGTYRPEPWEMVSSVSYPTYSYNTRIKYKPVSELIQTLAACASGNGNYLLGFVPDAEGAIPPEQVEIAREIGAWLKVNGAAIYSTRGGPWYSGNWGGSTHKGNLVYVHVFPNAPTRLSLPAYDGRVLKAHALNGLDIQWKQSDDGTLTLTIPTEGRDPNNTVIALTMDQPFSGMVKEKQIRTIFEGSKEYGTVISNDAKLEVSSSSQWNDPSTYSSFFTGERPHGFAFHTGEESNPHATVDLGKVKRLTGLTIENRNGMNPERAATLTVSISQDGESWKKVWTADGSQSRWEIPLTDFHDAGGKEPGKHARFLKLETHPDKPAALHLRRIEVYGFDK